MLNIPYLGLVPMTQTITPKKILGISIAAILAVGLAGSPLYADAIGDLLETEVTIAGDNYDRIVFTTADKIPKKGEFGGFAIVTEGHVIAVTDHGGFYDSEAQKAPKLPPTLPLSPTAAVCADGDKGCNSKWHTHLVEPKGSALCATGLAIGALSFEEPSEKVQIKAKSIILKNIALGTDSFTESLTNAPKDFTAGLPVDSDVVSGADTPFSFDGLAFDLTPTFDGPVAAENLVICIGDTFDPADLCAAIEAAPATDTPADAGTGLAYRDLIGSGGENNKVELSEFPFSAALFDVINTSTGDATPEGLGGVELQNWYDANCPAP